MYGVVTIGFIEVKLEIGGFINRLNCVAQVIAECDGTSYPNRRSYKTYRLTFYSLLLDEFSSRVRSPDSCNPM